MLHVEYISWLFISELTKQLKNQSASQNLNIWNNDNNSTHVRLDCFQSTFTFDNLNKSMN